MRAPTRPSHLLPVPVLLASALLLAACGGSADTGGEAAADAGAGADAGASEAAAGAGADACAALEGETVTLVVPYSPGGGYDVFARLIGPTLGEKVGATVVVENQPGAGGLLALNNLLTADADGTTLAIMNGIGAGGASIAEAEGAAFALDELSYVGRVAGDAQMIVTASDGPYESWEDVVAGEGFRFGSTGPGASDFVTPSLLTAAFGLDAEIVTGFEGSSEVELSMLQGDLDGMSGNLDSRQAALSSGDQQAVMTFDRERAEIAPDTPTVLEVELTPEQEELVEAHLSLLDVGRPIVGPPDMDPDALQCLRTGLEEALTDPALVVEAEASERPFNYLSGEELEVAIAGLLDAPEEYVAVLKESFAEGS